MAALVLALSVWLTAVPAAAQAVPEKPTGLTATAATHNWVTLEWDDPADASITVYEILLRTPTTEGSGVLSVIATTTASHSPGSCWTRVLVMVPEKWTVDEGDDAVFRLRRFGNYMTLPVNVEVAESNRDGSVLAPGERDLRTFTFEAINEFVTVSIPTVADDKHEGDDHPSVLLFLLQGHGYLLTSPSAGSSKPYSMASITVLNDDFPPGVKVTTLPSIRDRIDGADRVVALVPDLETRIAGGGNGASSRPSSHCRSRSVPLACRPSETLSRQTYADGERVGNRR